MKPGKTLLSVLIGGAIGSALAFLFAPKKGEDIRKNIKNNFDDIVNQTKEKGRRLFNQSMDIVDDIIKESDELRTLLKRYKEGTYEEAKEKVESEIKRLRTALFAAIDNYKNSKSREKSSDELISNIYSEFKNEAASNKTEITH
jgi:gas vesicle protein